MRPKRPWIERPADERAALFADSVALRQDAAATVARAADVIAATRALVRALVAAQAVGSRERIRTHSPGPITPRPGQRWQSARGLRFGFHARATGTPSSG